MLRRPQNRRRRPAARALALRPPPALPALDRDAVTALVGLAALAAALLAG